MFQPIDLPGYLVYRRGLNIIILIRWVGNIRSPNASYRAAIRIDSTIRVLLRHRDGWRIPNRG